MICEQCGVEGNATNLFKVFNAPFSSGTRWRKLMCAPCWSGGLITAPYPRPEPKPEEETDEWAVPQGEIIGACVHGGQDDGCDSCVEAVRRDNDNWETTY